MKKRLRKAWLWLRRKIDQLFCHHIATSMRTGGGLECDDCSKEWR